MMKTLSDKEKTQEQFNSAHQGFHGNPSVYEKEDVKQFIKDLKEEIKNCGEDDYYDSCNFITFEEIINKLAGDKLA